MIRCGLNNTTKVIHCTASSSCDNGFENVTDMSVSEN